MRTARAKGIRPWRVVTRHIFRNALLAVVSAFGFTFAALLSEAVVTETVFALPGIGRLVVQSILSRDYPVIQGIVLVVVVIYLVINLLVDISIASSIRGWTCNEGLALTGSPRSLRVPSRWSASFSCWWWCFAAIFADWIAPFDPQEMDPIIRLSPPNALHWFGTDQFGRDTLSRVIYSSRMALLVGVGVVVFALLTGVPIGVFSALFPRLGPGAHAHDRRAHGIPVPAAGPRAHRHPRPQRRQLHHRGWIGVPHHHDAHRLRPVPCASKPKPMSRPRAAWARGPGGW